MGKSFASHIFKEKPMNKKNISFSIQLKQNNNHIVQGIQQNDAGVLFDIKIMDGLEPFDFSGYGVVTLKIVKPDETVTYDSSGGNNVDIVDAEKGRLKLNIPTTCTAQNGMHFCTIGFSHDEETYFETTSFNYFVGENPTGEDEEVIGTPEYPVLLNLIAQVANIQSLEGVRQDNEEARKGAEENRQTTLESMSALLETIQQRLDDTQSMLNQLNEALADGGSIDISQINALATKSYVDGKTENTVIDKATYANLDLVEGELGYGTDTQRLYIGLNGSLVPLNEPCFVVGTSAPSDHTKLWIDSSNNTLKFYKNNAWTNLNAVFA